jgi:tetratricopeptide (TPR) repeat protein
VNPARWAEVKSIVAEALEHPVPQRLKWLDALSIADTAVAAEARRLVQQANEDEHLPKPADSTETYRPGTALLVYKTGGTVGPRFEIQEFLGKGGMGEVYAAFDRELNELIALKTLHAEYTQQPALIAHLKKEVQIAHRLQHPNLCRVHDIHRIQLPGTGETVAISMELLRGQTLSRRISQGPLEWTEALPIVRQLVAGLEAAHHASILHRDLKSGNVILVPGPGNAPKAVITDFGLAREMTSSTDSYSVFGLQAIVGTPPYMPPEQLRGEGVSAASDLYSLGVIVFEMVTGRLPFEGGTSLAIMLRRLEQEAPPARDFQPQLPARWDFAIGACLAKDPAARPGSPREFLRLLENEDEARRYWLRHYGRRAALAVLGAAACAGIPFFIPSPTPPSAHSDAAIASYKRGEEFVRRRNAEEIQNAIQEFRSALRPDPKYAEAWASLADAYCAAAHYDFMEPKVAASEAENAARTALRLNPRLAKAQGALAYVESIDLRRWRSAGPLFQEALALNEREPLPHAWYAAYLGRLGRFSDAIAQARRAVNLEPGFFYPNHQLAAEYFRAGRIPDYFEQSQELVRLQPSEPSAHLSLARAYEWLKRYNDALKSCAEAAKYGNPETALCFRGTIEAARGNRPAAERIARQIEAYWRQKPFETSVLANLLAKLGQYGKVMDILDLAYERGDGTVLACPTSLYLEPMKSLPRYQAFVRKLGFGPEILRPRS